MSSTSLEEGKIGEKKIYNRKRREGKKNDNHHQVGKDLIVLHTSSGPLDPRGNRFKLIR